jgi:nucleotide-binding universal stress UspA family protein
MLKIPIILHPTDYSSHSRYAFELACSLCRDHGSRLIVLHVVATLGPELVTFGEAVSQREPEAYQARLWADLREIQPTTGDIPVEHRLAEGDPAAMIVRTAHETGCGLIVMGTHGRTGLDRLVMGSVAEQVIRKAPCPTMTVRAPQSFAPPVGS